MTSILGLYNSFRQLVPNLVEIEFPLIWALKKNRSITFAIHSCTKLKAEDALKNAIISHFVPVLPYSGDQMTLDIDAYNVRISCFLLQKRSDYNKEPIGYLSRLLIDTEKWYDTMQQECLPIVWSILLLPPYIAGLGFKLRND